MSELILATEGPCAGHLCDNCKICQRGRCCRKDDPDYTLPKLGEWDGPIYGELGILNDDGQRVECHCCGEWFRGLAAHIVHRHNLLADEYKAIFGLNKGQGLTSAATHEKISINAKTGSGIGRLKAMNDQIRPTPEQLSSMMKGKKGRLQGNRSHTIAAKRLYKSGYRLAWTKLSDDDVREIRRRAPKGHKEKLVVATEFGISVHMIYEIMSGQRWKVLEAIQGAD